MLIGLATWRCSAMSNVPELKIASVASCEVTCAEESNTLMSWSRPRRTLLDMRHCSLNAFHETQSLGCRFGLWRNRKNGPPHGCRFRPDRALHDRCPYQLAKLLLQFTQI